MKTKSIGYAYPTSKFAEHFKAPKGCYFVAIGNSMKGAKSFSTYQDARAHADTLPNTYDRWSIVK